MKKLKPKKIRKVWGIKPQSRIHKSTKRKMLDRIKNQDIQKDLEP